MSGHRNVPDSLRTSRGAIDFALAVLFPWTNSNRRKADQYPGLLASLHGLVDKRVAVVSIRNWRLGLRYPPRWFVKVLYDRLESEVALRQEAMRRLAEMPPRPSPIENFKKKKPAV